MDKVEPAEGILCRIFEDHGQIDRDRAEHVLKVIGAVFKVDSIGISRD